MLNELGAELKHYVPNSRLHKIKSARDLFEFYSEPVNNLTEYAEMARDAEKPENLAVVEHAIRFHPNDKEAPHGGGLPFSCRPFCAQVECRSGFFRNHGLPRRGREGVQLATEEIAPTIQVGASTHSPSRTGN